MSHLMFSDKNNFLEQTVRRHIHLKPPLYPLLGDLTHFP